MNRRPFDELDREELRELLRAIDMSPLAQNFASDKLCSAVEKLRDEFGRRNAELARFFRDYKAAARRPL